MKAKKNFEQQLNEHWTNRSALWGYRRLWTCTLCNTFAGIFHLSRDILHPAPLSKRNFFNSIWVRNFSAKWIIRSLFICLIVCILFISFLFLCVNFVFISLTENTEFLLSLKYLAANVVCVCVCAFTASIWLNKTENMGSNENFETASKPMSNKTATHKLLRKNPFSLTLFLPFACLRLARFLRCMLSMTF